MNQYKQNRSSYSSSYRSLDYSKRYSNSSYVKYKRRKIYKYLYKRYNRYGTRKIYKKKYGSSSASYQFIKLNNEDNQKIIKYGEIIKRKAPLLCNVGFNLILSYSGKRAKKRKQKRKSARKANKRKKTFHGIESSTINGYQTIRIAINKVMTFIMKADQTFNIVSLISIEDINKENSTASYEKVLLNYVALDALVYMRGKKVLMDAFNMIIVKNKVQERDKIRYRYNNIVESNNSIIMRSTFIQCMNPFHHLQLPLKKAALPNRNRNNTSEESSEESSNKRDEPQIRKTKEAFVLPNNINNLINIPQKRREEDPLDRALLDNTNNKIRQLKNRIYFNVNNSNSNLVNYTSSKTNYVVSKNNELSVCIIPYDYSDLMEIINKNVQLIDESEENNEQEFASFKVEINGYIILTYKI